MSHVPIEVGEKPIIVFFFESSTAMTDAWFAAPAIEHGCTWVTRDRDYTRVAGLKVEFPLIP